MLSPLTDAKLAAGLLALEMDQRQGKAPAPGEVSLGDIAGRAGVAKSTVLQLERIAIAKAARALIADGEFSPEQIRRFLRSLESSSR